MAPKQPSADEWARWQWELRLPLWQRKVNRFCENWIFAFFIAMGIRHFALEAYRIPTASMEPMLYGDPAFSRADHVVVDKLLFRFTGPDRWGVTVFQFPWPEVSGPQGPTQPVRAWDGVGGRKDSFPLNPQLNRNFVKRCVVKPGDEFYMSGGDLYLKDGENWVIPPKPQDVQEALWMSIYRHGAEEGYVPWEGINGARVEARTDGLAFVPAGGTVRFNQPLSNLYLKPGKVKVKPMRSAAPFQVVDAEMTKPIFIHDDGTRRREGNIWNLNAWEVRRLTSADLDNAAAHGAVLNDQINEYIGDIRLGFTLRELKDHVTLALTEGNSVAVHLHLSPNAWQVEVDGQVVAEGNDSPVGSHWQVINCDNRVTVRRDGDALADATAVAATDPSRERTRLVWQGTGSVVVSGLHLERDLHYASVGFLTDQRDDWTRVLSDVDRHEIMVLRQQMLECLVDEALREKLLGELQLTKDGRRRTAWLEAVGNSPATALRAPEDGYLLLGDNSIFSWDGRHWGWVPGANLRGEVLWVVFPFSRAKVVR